MCLQADWALSVDVMLCYGSFGLAIHRRSLNIAYSTTLAGHNTVQFVPILVRSKL